MPTYEYRCPNGHDFERFYRKISDAESQVTCPECQAVAERRMSAGAGLLFKGSGFYLTDYGRNAHRSSAPGEPKSEGKKESGSESKPADSAPKSSAPKESTSAPAAPAAAPAKPKGDAGGGGGSGSKGSSSS